MQDDQRNCSRARMIEGEAMMELCQEFGISWKAGYKIFSRYKEEGIQALDDRSPRPGTMRESW